jgi:hypothetical protein
VDARRRGVIIGESLALSRLGASPDDIAGVCRLFQDVFGQPITESTWRWKYLSAPGGVAYNWVAHEAERNTHPLGHVGCLVLPGWWQGQPALMAHLTDVMVHSSVRAGLSRGSVYGRLMVTMAKELRALEDSRQTPVFAYGFPGRRPSRLGQRMGLYRPLLPNLQQPVWTHHVPVAAPVALSAPVLQARNLRLSQFIAPAPAPIPAVLPSLHKNATYLQWRYAAHPGRSYRLWTMAEHWGRPTGWAVTSTGTESWVVDANLPAFPDTPDTWSAVLCALAAATGCHTWRSWRPAGQAGIIDLADASLIVPGQFRVENILESDRRLMSEMSPKHGSRLQQSQRETDQPRFHPGDTDVF